MQNDPSFARQALQAGALGFVLKEAADDELLGAIRLAADGETYLNPRLGARLAAQPPEPAGPPDDLSEREVEVLKLIALGHTNAEIAGRLYLSVRTVESHRAHIQQKTRAVLARRARPLRARATGWSSSSTPSRLREPSSSRSRSTAWASGARGPQVRGVVLPIRYGAR